MERTTGPALKEKLIKELGATHVVRTTLFFMYMGLFCFEQEVKDNSDGCGLKFEVVIVSTQFQGKRLLDRHRMVHECLAKELELIHAFQQKTYTPEQWESRS